MHKLIQYADIFDNASGDVLQEGTSEECWAKLEEIKVQLGDEPDWTIEDRPDGFTARHKNPDYQPNHFLIEEFAMVNVTSIRRTLDNFDRRDRHRWIKTSSRFEFELTDDEVKERMSGSAMWDDPPDDMGERELIIWSRGYLNAESKHLGNAAEAVGFLESHIETDLPDGQESIAKRAGKDLALMAELERKRENEI